MLPGWHRSGGEARRHLAQAVGGWLQALGLGAGERIAACAGQLGSSPAGGLDTGLQDQCREGRWAPGTGSCCRQAGRGV